MDVRDGEVDMAKPGEGGQHFGRLDMSDIRLNSVEVDMAHGDSEPQILSLGVSPFTVQK